MTKFDNAWHKRLDFDTTLLNQIHWHLLFFCCPIRKIQFPSLTRNLFIRFTRPWLRWGCWPWGRRTPTPGPWWTTWWTTLNWGGRNPSGILFGTMCFHWLSTRAGKDERYVIFYYFFSNIATEWSVSGQNGCPKTTLVWDPVSTTKQEGRHDQLLPLKLGYCLH